MLHTLKINSHLLKFHTTPGVFAQYELDKGSLFLLKRIKLQTNIKRVLDLGCGCGVLGLSLSTLLSEAKVILMDSDIRAVRLARRNAKLNQLKNVQVELGDVAIDLPPWGKFDLIVSNPPTHQGKKVLMQFVAAAQQALQPTGEFYIVINRMKSLLSQLRHHFQEVEKIASRQSYIIIRSRYPLPSLSLNTP